MTLTQLNAFPQPKFGFGKSDADKAEDARQRLALSLQKPARDQFGLPLSGYTVGNTDSNLSYKPIGNPKHPDGFTMSSTQRSEFFTYA